MEHGRRKMVLSDIESTRNEVKKNTLDSRDAAKKCLNHFLKILPEFKDAQDDNLETKKLINEYGGLTFDTVFKKTNATGVEQQDEYKLKLSLITNFIQNAQKHLNMSVNLSICIN